MKGHLISCLLLFATFQFSVICAPLPQQKLPSKEMESFMKQFGYLDPGSGGEAADSLLTEEGFRTAVLQMQKYGGLAETGELDEATLNLTRSPRCGVPDLVHYGSRRRTRRYAIGSEAWKKRTITYILGNWAPEMDPDVIRSKLAQAFDLWSQVTPLTFVPSRDPSADIVVAFGRGPHGDGYAFDGPGSVLAHAFFPYEHGQYGGDIHFDDDENWIDGETQKKDEGVDFYTVAAHEIGHSLGLAHSAVSDSIMFPYYKGYDAYMRLGYDDIYAMYSMYVLDANFEDSTEATTEPQYPEDRRTSEGHDEEEGRSDDDRREDGKDEEDGNHDRRRDGTDENGDNEENGRGRENDEGNGQADEKDEDGLSDGSEDDVTFGSDEEDFDENEDTEKSTDSSTTDHIHMDTEAPVVSTDIPEVDKSYPKNNTDLCDGYIDAASLIRGELFVFKGKLMWRLGDRDARLPGYPLDFHAFFQQMPRSTRTIDAIYERPDNNIVVFTGRHYWVHTGNGFTRDSPRTLTDLGLPPVLDRVDAAFVWAKNGRTYLFAKGQYWRYDDKSGKMDSGYPQSIAARWRGLEPGIDSAFTWKNGVTYFFKDSYYMRFNNQNVSVDEGYPLPTRYYWFGCNQP